MTVLSALRAGTAAFALSAIVAPAAGQTPPLPQFVPAPTPTADALAAQMRQLGTNPRDVYALIAAGELSTKLGDPAAALGFFGRAQAVEPSNPRIAAGKAGALILLERPGEALQLYAQAERNGVAMTPYLTQRGLAYDLIGQPGYAQRDYRRALLADRDDETVRRLALSLGISGRPDEAMTLLDPLLRRSDRAAWRARACILAVTGDVAGAQRIAASMMAGGSALSPFFGRLQWLSLAERAFAVHFGEVGATVARATDARLAPVLVALPVEPQVLPSVAPAIASVTPPPTRRGKRRRPGREPMAVAAVMPMPTPRLPEPPGPQTQVAVRDPLPVFGSAPSPQRPPASNPVQRAFPAFVPAVSPTPPPSSPWAVTADSRTVSLPTADKPVIEIVTLPPPRRADAVAAPSPPPPRPTPTPALPPTSTPIVTSSPTAAPIARTAQPTVEPSPVTPAPPPPPQVRTPDVARRNTEVLASIIGTIAVPAGELDVAPPRAVTRKIVEPKPKLADADARKADAKKPDPKKPDPKKPDPKKSEPKKPDPTKTDPARWWVQVAGGANAADLGKDWKRLTTKSPTTFRGRTAWTTPLRATNRLLAGPFKSQGEAAALVNALAKDGASAFAWQSEAGQKIERLSPK